MTTMYVFSLGIPSTLMLRGNSTFKPFSLRTGVLALRTGSLFSGKVLSTLLISSLFSTYSLIEPHAQMIVLFLHYIFSPTVIAPDRLEVAASLL